MNAPIPPVRIETVAAKLAAIRNLEYPSLTLQLQDNPRFGHVLLFLEWSSRLAGGLVKFAHDLIERCPERVFPGSGVNPARQGDYSPSEKEIIWNSIPGQFQPQFPIDAGDWENPDYDLSRLTKKCVTSKLLEIARAHLPEYLASLCNHVSQPFFGTWYFPTLIETLVEDMDRHSAAEKKTFADTSVIRTMFDDFHFAAAKKQTVHTVGNPRSGKTEGAKGFCRCNPWIARYFSVPSSNSEADLTESIADALGLEFKPGRSGRDLRKRVEYVLKHTGLMLAADESQFLFPQKFSATTQPARLNWVRTEIIDKGLPLAICFTPQLYTPGLTSYLKKTGYVMDQWIGRRCIKRELPEQLPDEDLYAVARFHFPRLADDADYLEAIVKRAVVSPNYLQFMPALAARLEWIMQREGQTRISIKLLKSAMNDVMPPAQSKAQPANTESAPVPIRQSENAPIPIKRGSRPAPFTAAVALTPPVRELTPALQIVNT